MIKMKRNAQMKMMESVLVLVIFFFLLVFGIGFYVSFSKTTDKGKNSESQELYAIESVQRIKYMPELQCTKGGSEIIPDCFDIKKMKVFKEISPGNPRYNRLYPGISINITQVYPPNGFGRRGEIIYNDSPANISSVSSFFLPLTFYDPINRTYSFGFATIEVYS
jgi:hypothetical protein